MKNKIESKSIKFSWRGTNLELFPSRSLFVHETKELLICDIHLGKAEYFQLNGIPLTNNQDDFNFKRIYKLINKLNPEKLIILGDLFHSRYSLNKNLISRIQELSNYMNNKFELVIGNHDKGCLIKDIIYLNKKKSLNLIYTHEPLKNKEENILNICGHYHPKLILKNKRDKLSFKCFALDKKENILILPSFGDLTGGFLCKKEFKKWAIISDEIIREIK